MGDADERLLARVRALVAKAESTSFPEEAEAFMAKAQELITRHALDTALLGDGDRGGPTTRVVRLEPPYATDKARLLTAVADANGCRVVWSRATSAATVVGFPADLDAVELLTTSLLLQATGAVLRAEAPATGVRAFRHAFLVAFAQRIGERLAEAAAAATDAVATERSTDLLPVLASRREEVRAATAAAFPRLRTVRTTVRDPAAWAAGRQAADRAVLDRSGLGDAGTDAGDAISGPG